MISEGSRGTEDWSNDAENSGRNYILNIFTKNIVIIFHICTVFRIK